MANPPKWPIASDFNWMMRLNLEAAQLWYRELEVQVIDRVRTVKDPEYGESKNTKYNPFNLRAQCIINPKKTYLKKMGLDDDRDLVVNIPVAVLNEGTGDEGDYPRSAGGFPLPEEGDLFILEGERYKVMDETRGDYHWHEERYLTHNFTCVRLRDRSVTDEQPVDPANPAGPVETPTYSHTDFPGDDEAN